MSASACRRLYFQQLRAGRIATLAYAVWLWPLIIAVLLVAQSTVLWAVLAGCVSEALFGSMGVCRLLHIMSQSDDKVLISCSLTLTCTCR